MTVSSRAVVLMGDERSFKTVFRDGEKEGRYVLVV